MSRIPVAPLVKFLVFAVVTMLATTVLGLTIANSQGGDRTTYSARFEDVTGLLRGDDVRIAGVVVGSVKDIEVVDRRIARVDFEIDSSLRLPATTHAAVLYKNLIGQRFLGLSQEQQACNPQAPQTLAAGAVIPEGCTRKPLNLTELFNGFRPLFQALDPEQVNTLANEIIQVLQGQGGTIDSLLSSTASLTKTLADKDKVIGELIDNLNGVLDTVTSRNDQLNDLIVSLRELVAGLAEDREPIGNAISSIGDLAATTSSLLEEGRPALKADIAALGDLADQLHEGEPIIEHYLQFAPYKLNKIARAGSYGSWFNFYLCGLSGQIGITLPPPLPKIGPFQIPVTQSEEPRCSADPDGLGNDLEIGPPWPVPGTEYGDGDHGHGDGHDGDHGDPNKKAVHEDQLKEPQADLPLPAVGGGT
ncbi:MCE family protein [Pseudonocardia sp. CA-107938]|uniref:MCE family protein n=1 Tax=Pseudonocardia sp. CA-107938 TaxID=3240021 RepID=UPI003D924518